MTGLFTAVLFSLIAVYEWRFLRKRGRKPKTYVKVFAVLLVCFTYNFLLEWFRRLPSPNLLIEWIFGSLVRVFI